MLEALQRGSSSAARAQVRPASATPARSSAVLSVTMPVASPRHRWFWRVSARATLPWTRDARGASEPRRSTAATADTTSFVGELGFTGCLRLSEHWVARTGFTMFWLGNVAAAADQFSANNLFSQDIVSRIDTGANVFLYGLNLGLEAGW